MLRLVDFKYLRFFAFSIFLMSVQALGQFEVAPDHFDSSANTVPHQKTAKRGAGKTHSAAASPIVQPGAPATAAARSRHTSRPSKHAVRRPPAVSQTASTSTPK
jgi:hypothetical protein